MTDFIRGENRHHSTLFPERLDDYIAAESAVRVCSKHDPTFHTAWTVAGIRLARCSDGAERQSGH